MNTIIALEAQKLEQDARVVLYEIDATRWGQGVLRFTNHSDEGQPLMYGGYEYIPFAMQATGFQWTGNGSQPRPKLTTAATDASFMALIIGNDDLVGAQVKRIRTYRKHLDDGESPDSDAYFEPDYYTVERKSEQTSTTVTFELSMALTQKKRRIPNRQCLRDTCTHTYRYWDGEKFIYKGVSCPYADEEMYDVQGVQTSDPAEDECSKDLTRGCKIRFGENGRLPFRGFPGLART